MAQTFSVKYIMIGDQGVGKSSLLIQLKDQKFHPNPEITVGVDFFSKQMMVDQNTIKLQIWDTAGQETFHSITKSYYRGSCAAIIVYDISRRETFNHVISWLYEAKQLSHDHMVFALIGNKTDVGRRFVSFEEGMNFAQEHGLIFGETSAKASEAVEEIFDQINRTVIERVHRGKFSPNDPSHGITILSSPVPSNNIGLSSNLSPKKKRSFC